MERYIYKVHFNQPPYTDNVEVDFYFTSLAAIYELFTPAQIGCKVRNIWNAKISLDNSYIGRKCTITKHKLTNKPQKIKYGNND